ncbi:MAG: extracellular solute-binding protein [Lachnospiraceae bacterium]|nr:extracellular solute-binding protein [Lachnospiraceae bacterium]
MLKNKLIKQITATLLAGIMLFGLAACGKEEENGGKSSENNGNGTQPETMEDDGDYVYIPKVYELSDAAEADAVQYSSITFDEDKMYYICESYQNGDRSLGWWCFDAANPEAGPVMLMDLEEYAVREEAFSGEVINATVSGDGGTILLVRTAPLVPADATDEDYARRAQDTTYQIKKIAADGGEVYGADITDCLFMDRSSYPQKLFTDKEGNLYISNDTSYVWVFDKEGNHKADIDLKAFGGQRVTPVAGILPDGRLGIMYEAEKSIEIAIYNQDTKQFSETYSNLPPDCGNIDWETGPHGGILLSDNSSLYEYDMEAQAYTELIKWVECDLQPAHIKRAAALKDGSIAVYCLDNAQTASLIVLEKVPASEVEKKETLVLGCLGYDRTLEFAVVAFNKESDKYQIEIMDYTELTESYEDAKTRFYNDILTGNAPDMFPADDIDMKLFAVRGLIEDLSPYLESSEAVRREDLFETVLNAYTIDGVLCAIPYAFSIETLVGRTSEVGEESGWTLEEMIAFAEAYPESTIYPDALKANILHNCLRFDYDSWVNWEDGTCSFNTTEFKKLLEFANQYPAGAYVYADITVDEQIGGHMALLNPVRFTFSMDWQIEELIFGEPITAIGYPSAGKKGVLAFGESPVCVSASSTNKETAWSFIESLLSEEAQEDEELAGSFPIRITSFEKKLAQEMEPNYMRYADGSPVLDADGNPKEVPKGQYRSGDKQWDIYPLTEEQAGSIRYVISQIDGFYDFNDSLIEIIDEEAASYFGGQKSVDEVADIIQNRVQLYLDENR